MAADLTAAVVDDSHWAIRNLGRVEHRRRGTVPRVPDCGVCMKLAVKVLTPLVVLLVAATTAVAMADPYPLTEPDSRIPANNNVCVTEKIAINQAQGDYNNALDRYRRAKQADDRAQRPVTAAARRDAEQQLHEAQIKLTNAKFAEAACRNNLGNNPDKTCLALVLELQRLKAEAPLRRALERLAGIKLGLAQHSFDHGGISQRELDEYVNAKNTAVANREAVERAITAQEQLIRDTPACRDFPTTPPPPELLPPPREVPPNPPTTSSQPTTPTIDPTVTSTAVELPTPTL